MFLFLRMSLPLVTLFLSDYPWEEASLKEPAQDGRKNITSKQYNILYNGVNITQWWA